jgi:class 3 adenylate cyclase/tetratricopeptide (TPR) repeat protein
MDIGPERRHLTVLFCDLVGSTELSQALDPEDLRVVMSAYEEACTEAVERFDGYVAQFYGDGVLAYFGYPVTHEDSPQRAVRAAMELVRTVRDVPSPRPLEVRVGIHSGLVVVGMEKTGVPGKSNSATGESLNVAARLQALATAGEIVVSAATHELVADDFEFVDGGVHALRGITEPVPVFKLSPDQPGAGMVAGRSRSLTKLVGRERDLEAILQRWESTREGAGQVVLINGEAGIGKSRLVHAVRESLRSERLTLMRHHCSQYLQTTPLHPIAESVEWMLAFDRDADVDARLARIEEWVSEIGLDSEEAVPLVAGLLKIPLPDTPDITAQETRTRTLAALHSVVRQAATRKPVLFVIESVQWADPTTLEFLAELVEQAATMPVLVLITHRLDFQPPWPARSHVLPITLTRLSATETEVIAREIAGNKALPVEVVETIVSRADGVPMFIEELTKTMLDSNYLEAVDDRWELVGRLPPVAVPVSLQDSLMARLDRLGPYREVAQVGAMIGRSFRFDVLAAVRSLGDEDLERALDALVRDDLLLQRGLPPDSSYIFRQALIQEVAYESLLISQRQDFHGKIAEVLETRFPDIAEAEPEQIARHYATAGICDRAVSFRMRAAQLSVSQSSMAEALAHADGALAMMDNVPESPEKRRQGADLHLMRGWALTALSGFFDPEVRQSFEAARDLADDADLGVQRARAWVGLYAHNVSLDQLDEARDIATKLLDLSRKLDRDDILFSAYLCSGVSAADIGDIRLAENYLQSAIDRLVVLPEDQGLWMTIQDPGVVAWSMLSRMRFMLGHPEGAEEAVKQAVDRAEKRGHAISLAFATSSGGALYSLMRRWKSAEDLTARASEIAVEKDFKGWQIHSAVYHGLASVQLGRVREGLAEAETAVELGNQSWRNGPPTFLLVALAEMYRAAGRHENALAKIRQGIDRTTSAGGKSYEAELHRLLGGVLGDMALGEEVENRNALLVKARNALRHATSVAESQGALSWQLRVAMELVRHNEKHGLDDDGFRDLIRIYDCFEEGMDSPDLADARALRETVAT